MSNELKLTTRGERTLTVEICDDDGKTEASIVVDLRDFYYTVNRHINRKTDEYANVLSRIYSLK